MKFKGGILATLALVAVCAGLMLAMPDQVPTKEQFHDDLGKAVVYIHIGQGGGTGFVIKAKTGNPYLITNNHICKDQKQLLVNQADWEQPHSVDVIRTFPELDLCIAMPPAGVPALELGEDVKLHDLIAIIGHPMLRPLEVSMGEILTRSDQEVVMGQDEACIGGRHQSIDLGFFQYEVCVKSFNAYAVSNHIEPGNSGSPVLNMHGKVVGVVFAGNSATGSIVPWEFLSSVLARY